MQQLAVQLAAGVPVRMRLQRLSKTPVGRIFVPLLGRQEPGVSIFCCLLL
jgi:hypothetical protein